MAVTVVTPNPTVGQTVTLHLKYEGNPPEPNDVHIDVRTEDGFVPIVGYSTIPADKKPFQGFDMPVPPTPHWATPGQHRFQVRWTRNGEHVGAEAAFITTRPRPPGPHDTDRKEWKWLDFWGKVIGGSVGSAVSAVLLNWWTGVGILACIVTGGIGGMISGGLGYFIVWLLDAPRINFSFRSSLLFTMFWTIAFSMVLGLLAIDLEREWAAREWFNRVTFGVSAVSTLLACMLAGVMNNLRIDEGRVDPGHSAL